MENYKYVKGFRLYRIYPDGRIYSELSQDYLKPYKDSQGRPRVNFPKDGGKKEFLVSRLVALHFVPNPHGLPEVLHKDGNVLNFNASNLEWTIHASGRHDTPKQIAHSKKLGESSRKLTLQQAKEIRRLYKAGKSRQELADMFGVGVTTISNIVRDKSYKGLLVLIVSLVLFAFIL